MTLFWPDGQLLIDSRGTYFPNWPSLGSHHRFHSRDSPQQTVVIAFLSRALVFFVLRAQGGKWQMTMSAALSALPRGHCQFPFVVQIDSQKVGHSILTPHTVFFHEATTSWCFSPWTAGANSSSQASDFKQQWEEACLRQMPATSLGGEEFECVSHYLIPLHWI